LRLRKSQIDSKAEQIRNATIAKIQSGMRECERTGDGTKMLKYFQFLLAYNASLSKTSQLSVQSVLACIPASIVGEVQESLDQTLGIKRRNYE
jgi:hypothetical protein